MDSNKNVLLFFFLLLLLLQLFTITLLACDVNYISTHFHVNAAKLEKTGQTFFDLQESHWCPDLISTAWVCFPNLCIACCFFILFFYLDRCYIWAHIIFPFHCWHLISVTWQIWFRLLALKFYFTKPQWKSDCQLLMCVLWSTSPSILLNHLKGSSFCPSRCMFLYIDLSSACSLIIVAQALHCRLPPAFTAKRLSVSISFLPSIIPSWPSISTQMVYDKWHPCHRSTLTKSLL